MSTSHGTSNAGRPHSAASTNIPYDPEHQAGQQAGSAAATGKTSKAGAPAAAKSTNASASSSAAKPDSYGQGPVTSVLEGPTATATDEDIDPVLSQQFTAAGSPYPKNDATNAKTLAGMKASPAYGELKDTLVEMASDPKAQTPEGQKFYNSRLAAAMDQMMQADSNVQEYVFILLRDAMKDINEDRKLSLRTLQNLNKMGEALSGNMRELTEKSSELAQKEMTVNKDDPEAAKAQSVVVQNKTVNTDHLDSRGQAIVIPRGARSENRTSLGRLISQQESEMETVRNKRQQAMTSFQNADQKFNQIANMTAQLLKVGHESQSRIIGNTM